MRSSILKPAGVIALLWLLFVGIPSIPEVRAMLAAPLVVTDAGVRGDACYVLASGNALQERLAAAADLFHLKRIPKILLMRDNAVSSYSFTAHASWTATQWAVEYLAWLGVPRDKVILVEGTAGFWGTLREARNIARVLPRDVKKLVLVTSAPHTRRSLLAFKRVLPAGVTVVAFAATPIETSSEIHCPIWLEYLKLFVYAVIA